jgi:three-Cys-motif partner protein
VYFDGYAGPGPYDDGSPGSPLLAVETARATARWDRKVECLFVEKDPAHAANLERTLAEEAPGMMAYQVWPGDVADYVDRALEIAGEDPMFTFLDPFGTALSYANLTAKLLGRASNKPTEVLLNLNLEGVWRIGGLLTGDAKEDGAEATLNRLNGFFGDNWWRNEFRRARASGDEGSAADAALSVANEFRKRVRAATGFRTFGVEVRRRRATSRCS